MNDFVPMTREQRVAMVDDLLKKYPAGKEGIVCKADYTKSRMWCQLRQRSYDFVVRRDRAATGIDYGDYGLMDYLALANEHVVRYMQTYLKHRPGGTGFSLGRYNSWKYLDVVSELLIKEHHVSMGECFDTLPKSTQSRRLNRLRSRLEIISGSTITTHLVSAERTLGTYFVRLDTNIGRKNLYVNASNKNEAEGIVRTMIIPAMGHVGASLAKGRTYFVGKLPQELRQSINMISSQGKAKDIEKRIEELRDYLKNAEEELAAVRHTNTIITASVMGL